MNNDSDNLNSINKYYAKKGNDLSFLSIKIIKLFF